MIKFIQYFILYFFNKIFLWIALPLIVFLCYITWNKVNIVFIISLNLFILIYLILYKLCYIYLSKVDSEPLIKLKWISFLKWKFVNEYPDIEDIFNLEYYWLYYDELKQLGKDEINYIYKDLYNNLNILAFLRKWVFIKIFFGIRKILGNIIYLMSESNIFFWFFSIFIIILFPFQFIRLCILGNLKEYLFYLKGKLRGFRDIFFYKYFGWDSREFFMKISYYYYKYVDWLPRNFIRKPFLLIFVILEFFLGLYRYLDLKVIILVRLFALNLILILFFFGVYPLINHLYWLKNSFIFEIFTNISIKLGINLWLFLILLVIYLFLLLVFPLILWIRFFILYWFEKKKNVVYNINSLNKTEEEIEEILKYEENFYSISSKAYKDIFKYIVNLNGWNMCLQNDFGIFKSVFKNVAVMFYVNDLNGNFSKRILKSNIFFWWKWFGEESYIYQTFWDLYYYYMKDKIYERGYVGLCWYDVRTPILSRILLLLLTRKEIVTYHPDKEHIEEIIDGFDSENICWDITYEQKQIIWRLLKLHLFFVLELNRMYNVEPVTLFNISNSIESICKIFNYKIYTYGEVSSLLGLELNEKYNELIVFYENIKIDSEAGIFTFYKSNLRDKLDLYTEEWGKPLIKNKEFSVFQSLHGFQVNKIVTNYYNNVDNHKFWKNIKIPKTFKSVTKSEKLKIWAKSLDFFVFISIYEPNLINSLNKENKILYKLGKLDNLRLYYKDVFLYNDYYQYGFSKLLEKIIPWCEEYKQLSNKTPESELVIEKFKDKLWDNL